MTVNPGDVIRVSARFKDTLAGDVVNVWHWRADGTGTATDEDIMTAIRAKLSTAFAMISTQLHQDTNPYDIRFDIVEMVGGVERVTRPMATQTWTLTTPPAGSADALPQMDAAIINFRTSIPKVFGRKYLGVLQEGVNAAGVLSGAAITALTNFAAEMLSDITSGTITLHNGVLTIKNPIIFFTDFLAAVITPLIGTQRRRRAGSGG